MFGFGFGFGRQPAPPVAGGGGPSFPSTGLVAYWGFDDSLTDSVGSNVLTASGGNSYVTGKLGTKALQLTGGNTATTFDATISACFAGACSIQIWAKSATISTGFTPLDAGGSQWSVTAYDTSQAGAYDIGNSGATINGTDTLVDDTWFHIVVTSDGGTSPAKMYVNNHAYTGDLSVALGDGGQLQIGGATAATITVDACAVWNVCLTAQQVSTLYNSGNGLSP